MNTRKEKLGGYVFCLIAAALILMICTQNSYLYPLNPGTDVNCFVTVADGMMNGLLPYRDLVEQKGPLLYFLHIIGIWLSPGTYYGIYLLEVVSMSLSLYLFWLIMRLYIKDLNVSWIAVTGAIYMASKNHGVWEIRQRSGVFHWCLLRCTHC